MTSKQRLAQAERIACKQKPQVKKTWKEFIDAPNDDGTLDGDFDVETRGAWAEFIAKAEDMPTAKQ